MRKNFLSVLLSVYILSLLIQTAYTMPGADGEGNDNETEKAPATGAAAPTGNKEEVAAAKATPLTWPATTQVDEDNKRLLQSNNKEIVQIFTLSQEVCKNIDEILGNLNTQRDAANKQFRTAIKELDPLFQRIGAAQADNKKK